MSRSARIMHLETLAWCALNRSDGWMPAEILATVTDASDPAQMAAELVNAHIWEAGPDGWQIADAYLDGGAL